MLAVPLMLLSGFVTLALAGATVLVAQTGDQGNASRTTAPRAGQPATIDGVLGFLLPVAPSEPARPERTGEFLMSVGGPVPLIGEAAGAGISQWMNAPEEWHQGWAAFGKRYGSNLAYNGIRQTIAFAGSNLLNEDVRYFASGKSGFWRRTAHAALSPFTARRSNARQYFSVSNTASVIGASSISSVWGPPSWKGPGNIAENAGISFASTALTNMIREFLPDIFHRMRR